MDTLRAQSFERNSEIIAAFFTSRYYNDLYCIAKDHFARRGGESLTAVYVGYLYEYLKNIETAPRHAGPDIMRDTIVNLHAYYCKLSSEVSLDEFVMIIVSQIVPDEFLSTITGTEKSSMLRELVKQTALVVGKRALKSDMLRYIIDDRANRVGVNILSDIGATVLRQFRASMISQLYSKKMGTVRRTVDGELFDRMRAELKRAVESGVEYCGLYDGARREIARLRAQLASATAEISSLRSALRAQPIATPARIDAASASEQPRADAPRQYDHAPDKPRIDGPPGGTKLRASMLEMPSLSDDNTPRASASDDNTPRASASVDRAQHEAIIEDDFDAMAAPPARDSRMRSESSDEEESDEDEHAAQMKAAERARAIAERNRRAHDTSTE
jgi:hypothetical protein